MRPVQPVGSLSYIVWLFILCIFYLLPVIFLAKYIGGWAWPAGIAFWLFVFCSFKFIASTRRDK